MENYTDEQLKALTACEWVEILKETPELADKCYKWRSFDAEDWCNLLSNQPQLADSCDKVNGWEEFRGRCSNLSAYIDLLVAQPQFACKRDKVSDWAKLGAKEWYKLLSKQPLLADRCDKVDGWKQFLVKDWIELLSKQPQLADRCDKWEDFDAEDWCNLLSNQPQLADRCDKVDGWFCLIDDIGYIHNKIMTETVDAYYSCEYYGGVEDYDDYLSACSKLLTAQPQLANRLFKRDDFPWLNFLSECPQFADECDRVNGWGHSFIWDWLELLSLQPQFADRCDKVNAWEEFARYTSFRTPAIRR